MGHHYGQLTSRVMENMDRDGLSCLDVYMKMDESMDSKIGCIDFFREWFRKWFIYKGTLS